MLYIRVADVAAATARAKSLGAKVLTEGVEIPAKYVFSTFVDLTGARRSGCSSRRSARRRGDRPR